MIEHWHIICVILFGWGVCGLIFTYLLDCIDDLRRENKNFEKRLRGAEERARKANHSVLFQKIKYPGDTDECM